MTQIQMGILLMAIWAAPMVPDWPRLFIVGMYSILVLKQVWEERNG